MYRNSIKRKWLVCGLPLVVGCGAIPEIVVDAARASAKEALEETIDDVVDGVVDQTIGEFLDFEDLDIPFIDDLDFPFDETIDDGDELDDGEAVDFSDDVDQDLDESDQDSELGGGRR